MGDVNTKGVYRVNGIPIAGQTPWKSNIDAAGHKLSNIPEIDGQSVFTLKASSHLFLDTPRVGIHLTNPQYTVDVMGDINISGAYRILGVPIEFLPSHSAAQSGDVLTVNASGHLEWRVPTGGGGGAGNQTPWISNISGDGFTLNNAGAIGIGKSSPAFPLDVVGDVNISGIFRVNGQPLSFSPWTGNIDGAGHNLNNVGTINTGDIYIGGARLPDPGNMILNTGSYSNPSWITSLSWDKITGAPAQLWSRWGADIVYTNDKVGVNTTDVIYRFEVAGRIRLKPYSTDTAGIWFNTPGRADAFFLGATAGSDFRLYSAFAAANVLYFDGVNSRAGFNKASADYTVDVNGDCNVAGVYRIRGTPINFPPSTVGAYVGDVLTVNSSGDMIWAPQTGGGGGGSQTPWLSNIDAAGYQLANLNQITFIYPTGLLSGWMGVNAAGNFTEDFRGNSHNTYASSIGLVSEGVITLTSNLDSGLAFNLSTVSSPYTLRVLVGGNVGVGLQNPEARLDVNGAGVFRDIGPPQSSGKWCRIGYDISGDMSDLLSYDAEANAYKMLQIRGNPTVFTAGNVIVGAANSVTNIKLEISDGVDHRLSIGSMDWIDAPSVGLLATNDFNSALGNLTYWANKHYLGGGWVGIGTANPLAPLHVEGNILSKNQIEIQGQPTAGLTLHVPFSSVWGIVNNANRLSFNATGPEVFTITNGGYVGIGVTDPGYILDINGIMRFRNTVGYTGAWLDGANQGSECFWGMEPGDWIFRVYSAYPGIGNVLIANLGTGSVSVGNSVIGKDGTVVVNNTGPIDPYGAKLQVRNGLVIDGTEPSSIGHLRIPVAPYGIVHNNDGSTYRIGRTTAWDPWGGVALWLSETDLGTGNVSFPGQMACNNVYTNGIQCNGNINAGSITIGGVPISNMGSQWTSFPCDIRNSTGNTVVALAWGYAWYRIHGAVCFLNVSFYVNENQVGGVFHMYLPQTAVAYAYDGVVMMAFPDGTYNRYTTAQVNPPQNLITWSGTAGQGWIHMLTAVYRVA